MKGSAKASIVPLILAGVPVDVGKRIAKSTWLHIGAVHVNSETKRGAIAICAHPFSVEDLVVRVDEDKERVALLHYLDFATEPRAPQL